MKFGDGKQIFTLGGWRESKRGIRPIPGDVQRVGREMSRPLPLNYNQGMRGVCDAGTLQEEGGIQYECAAEFRLWLALPFGPFARSPPSGIGERPTTLRSSPDECGHRASMHDVIPPCISSPRVLGVRSPGRPPPHPPPPHLPVTSI